MFHIIIIIYPLSTELIGDFYVYIMDLLLPYEFICKSYIQYIFLHFIWNKLILEI